MRSKEEIQEKLLYYNKQIQYHNQQAEKLSGRKGKVREMKTEKRLADMFFQKKNVLMWVLKDNPEGETVSDVGRKSD